MKRLRGIAEAATPGPWVARGNLMRSGGIPVIEHTVAPDENPSWIVADVRDAGEVDAEYIATFDPPTVLALLDVAEAAEWWEREPCQYVADGACLLDDGLDTEEWCIVCASVDALARLREASE